MTWSRAAVARSWIATELIVGETLSVYGSARTLARLVVGVQTQQKLLTRRCER